MSRPEKTGLDYFPLDTETDEKIEYIEADFEADREVGGPGTAIIAWGIVTRLWQRIYRECGYYYAWNETQKKLFCRKYNVNINQINVVINSAIACGLFHKPMFEQHQILTSSGIQKRYLTATSRRKTVQIEQKYLLCQLDEYKNAIIVDINSIDSHRSTQSKVNKTESKENQNKAKQTDTPPQDSPQDPFDIPPAEDPMKKALALFKNLVGVRKDFDPVKFLETNAKGDEYGKFHPKAFLEVAEYFTAKLHLKSGSNGSAKYEIETPAAIGRFLLKKKTPVYNAADSEARNNAGKKGLKTINQILQSQGAA